MRRIRNHDIDPGCDSAQKFNYFSSSITDLSFYSRRVVDEGLIMKANEELPRFMSSDVGTGLLLSTYMGLSSRDDRYTSHYLLLCKKRNHILICMNGYRFNFDLPGKCNHEKLCSIPILTSPENLVGAFSMVMTRKSSPSLLLWMLGTNPPSSPIR